MSKRGFTMIELLATIVIIGILSISCVMVVQNVIEKGKREYYQAQEEMITLAGKEYFSDYRSKLPKEIGPLETVTLETLIGENYIEEVVDYRKKACDYKNSKVTVQKQGKEEYSYYSFLKCDTYNGEKDGTNPAIYFLPNSKKTNQDITVLMKIRDNQKVEAYSYVVYKNDTIIKTVGKREYKEEVKIPLTGEGRYKIIGTAYDNEEHTTIKTSGEYVIDKTPPDCSKVEITSSVPQKTWTSQDITLTFTFKTDVSYWEWYTKKDEGNFKKIDNNKQSVKSKHFNVTGKHQGQIVLYDEVGNSCKKNTDTYYIDKIVPKVELSGSIESGKLTNKDIQLTATPTPAKTPSGYTYIFEKKEGTGWKEIQKSDKNTCVVKEEGKNTYRVRIITGAGKEGISNTYQTNVDKTAPDCSKISIGVTGGEENKWTKSNIVLTINKKSSDIVSYDVFKKTAKEAYAAILYNQKKESKVTLNATGTYQVKVKAYDAANNFCEKETGSYKIDKTKPTVPTSTVRYDSAKGTVRKNSDTWTNKTLWWGNFKADDTYSKIDHYEYSTKCTGKKSGNLKASYTYDTDRNSKFCIRAVDKAGNASNWSGAYYFKIDKTKPSCKVTKTHPDNKLTSKFTVTFSCTDALSGVKNCTETKKGVGEGSYHYDIVDHAGNKGACTFEVTKTKQYKKRSCQSCKRCSSAGCAAYGAQTCSQGSFSECSHSKLEGKICVASGGYGNGQTCYSGGYNYVCYHKVCNDGSCIRYNASCPSCGCGDWGSYSSTWSKNNKCNATKKKRHQCSDKSRVIYS